MMRSSGLSLCAAAIAMMSGCTDRADMHRGARIRPLGQLPGAPDWPVQSVPPEGTIARDEASGEPPRPAITMDLLIRGQERFGIYCTPCHARDGYGDGIVVRHGFPPPPSLHDRDVRTRGDDVYFRVITQGLGKMPPYASAVPSTDRWAIISYIRALQLSQNAPAEDVPAGATVLPPGPSSKGATP
jgi:mono/diheme cytochrome c family protein